MIGRVAALALMLPAATIAGAAAAARLQSGVYEGLQLAVAPNGAVAGIFTRETDTAPTRTCDFDFTGHLLPNGNADVTVRSSADDPTLHGSLVRTGDGVALHVPKLTDLPACDQLVDVPPRGVPFARIGLPHGTWLASVSAKRAQLHLAATGGAWHGYLVKDDYVALGARKGARWEAVFLSPAGRRSHGWLDAADVEPFARR